MSEQQASAPGQRYRLDRRIATGGMGEVWEGEDTVLRRPVAVKVLKPEFADDSTFRTRFQSEARNAAALQHPNVASVFDFGEALDDDGSGKSRPFLVMEMVPGEPLSALLVGGRPMPPETAADLVAQAADGITAAHALGIVHRDVKPGNLMVTPGGHVKITDFGIARAADNVALTQTGQVIGTPHYLSPEQAAGHQATKASDIYSLGVVLYECLAGHRPFAGETPVTTALAHMRDEAPPLPAQVPDHLADVVSKALAKDPEKRFATAAELGACLRGAPVEETPPTATLTDPGVAGAGAAGAAAATAAADAPATRVLSPHAPAHSRRRPLPTWLPWAAAAAGVLLVIGLLTLISGNDNNPGPAGAAQQSPSSTSPSPTQPAGASSGVRVRRAAYVGMPYDEARNRLEARGLDVAGEREQHNPGGHPEHTVADVSPTGRVDPGSTITLTTWGPEPKPQKPKHEKPKEPKLPKLPGPPGQGQGNGQGNNGHHGHPGKKGSQ